MNQVWDILVLCFINVQIELQGFPVIQSKFLQHFFISKPKSQIEIWIQRFRVVQRTDESVQDFSPISRVVVVGFNFDW